MSILEELLVKPTFFKQLKRVKNLTLFLYPKNTFNNKIFAIQFAVSKITSELPVDTVEDKPLTRHELKEMIIKSRENPDGCLMCGS